MLLFSCVQSLPRDRLEGCQKKYRNLCCSVVSSLLLCFVFVPCYGVYLRPEYWCRVCFFSQFLFWYCSGLRCFLLTIRGTKGVGMAYACANTINMQNGERNQNARMDARKRRVQASRRGSVLHVFSFRRRSIGIDGAGFFLLLLFVCLFVCFWFAPLSLSIGFVCILWCYVHLHVAANAFASTTSRVTKTRSA